MFVKFWNLLTVKCSLNIELTIIFRLAEIVKNSTQKFVIEIGFLLESSLNPRLSLHQHRLRRPK